MRLCQKCKAQDRAEIDAESVCKCGAVAAGHEDHHPECPRLIHSVTQYFVRISLKELTIDKALSPYYAQQGWKLLEDGGRVYRWMLLCRDCIRTQEDALARQKDYQAACRRLQGLSDKSYSQMLAAQSF